MASLFDYIPISHTDDPSTSHESADTHTASGRREKHAAIVLDTVRRFPGFTAIELWDCCCSEEKQAMKEPQEVRRRLTDLLHSGKVVQGIAKVCSV